RPGRRRRRRPARRPRPAPGTPPSWGCRPRRSGPSPPRGGRGRARRGAGSRCSPGEAVTPGREARRMPIALVALLAGTTLGLAVALAVVLTRLASAAPGAGGEVALAERAAGFEARVDGLGTQLDRLGSLVQQLERRSAHHHGQLVAGIEQVATTSQ